MFIRRWIEGFETGDSDTIGMVCCEIGLVSLVPAVAAIAVAFAIQAVWSEARTVALAIFLVGAAITMTLILFILVVAFIQLGKAIFGPQQHEGFDI